MHEGKYTAFHTVTVLVHAVQYSTVFYAMVHWFVGFNSVSIFRVTVFDELCPIYCSKFQLRLKSLLIFTFCVKMWSLHCSWLCIVWTFSHYRILTYCGSSLASYKMTKFGSISYCDSFLCMNQCTHLVITITITGILHPLRVTCTVTNKSRIKYYLRWVGLIHVPYYYLCTIFPTSASFLTSRTWTLVYARGRPCMTNC